ncbi:TPA: putative phage abortive infection protein [Bacillus cereus]|nr:putative phage abortive infection protein [Bacillus cereus]
MSEEKKLHKKSTMSSIQDGFIGFFFLGGLILLVTAVAMPFKVKEYYETKIEGYKTIADLGPVGDFIGGTTVALLTAASVVLLLATIIMQRKEIKISQQSIEELVKQTEASIAQADLAREETKITNETMKRQQFETTFFNMINLHHNILKEIRYENSTGREAILKLYNELRDTYDNQVYKRYKTQFINDKFSSNNDYKLTDLIKKVLVDKELLKYTQDFEKSFMPAIGYNEKEDFREQEFFYYSIINGTDGKWYEKEGHVIEHFEMNIKYDREWCRKILEEFDFKGNIEKKKSINHEYITEFEKEKSINHEYITEFKMNYSDNPLIELRHEAYETLYKKYENAIGHYYRNLYRIVKLIQNNTFDSKSQELDNEEKRQYRGILRAQLSSFELLMLFYNISYSKKGENFKKLIAGINFFDDHLIEKDFIWKNDIEQLARLNTSGDIAESN